MDPITKNAPSTGPSGSRTRPNTASEPQLPTDAFRHAGAVKREVSLGDVAGVVFSEKGKIRNESMWESSIGDFSSHSPTHGADNTILVTNACGYPHSLYAFDRTTGKQMWQAGLSGSLDKAPWVTDDGTVIAGTRGKTVAAFDGKTGEKKWEFATGDQIARPPVVGKDGTLFFSTLNDEVHSVNPRTGKHRLLFKKDIPEKYPQSVSPSMAVGKDGTLYIGCGDHNLYAVNPKSGKEKWHFTAHTAFLVDPVIADDGTVFAAEKDWHLYALDGKTGARKWEASTNPGWSIDDLLLHDGGGKLFAGDSMYTFCFDAATGKKLWQTDEPSVASAGSPRIIEKGALIVSTFSGVQAWDIETGAKKWQFDMKQNSHLAPRPAGDGTLYAASQDGAVYALDAEKGEKKWAFQAGGNIYNPPTLSPDGFVYFSATDGNIYCIRGDRKPGIVVDGPSPSSDGSVQKGDGFVIIGGVKLPAKKMEGA